jgi:hypothetical protein
MEPQDRERLAVIEERTRCLPALVEKVGSHAVEIARLQVRMDARKVTGKKLIRLLLGAIIAVAGVFGIRGSVQ